MTITFSKSRIISAILFAALSLSANIAMSTEHTVTAVAVKFKPMFVYIEPGDTINFESMGGHNVETIDLMSPEGFEKINSELGENISFVFESEGIIVFKCTPHWGARMGGIIVVGQPEDPSAILDGYMATLESDRSNLPAKGLLKKLRKDMEKKGLL